MELLLALPLLAFAGLFAGGGTGSDDPDDHQDAALAARDDADTTRVGTTGDDRMRGTGGADFFRGRDGDDTLLGRGDADTLDGGNGDDLLWGGSSGDQLNGQRGADLLSGGGGSDRLAGGIDDDTIFGGGGNDTVLMGAGDGSDRVVLGFGDDSVSAAAADETLTVSGQAGNDYIRTGGGDDQLYGGQGFDTLWSEDGADLLAGGAGNDLLISTGRIVSPTDTPEEGAVLTGGLGDDVLWADAGDTATGGQGVDSFGAYLDDSDTDVVTLTDFDPEQDRLSVFTDALGPSPDLSLRAVEGGTMVVAGGQDLVLLQGLAPDQVDLDQIEFTHRYDDGVEGTVGSDLMEGDDGSDVFFGGSGNDTLIGGGGSDVLNGGGDRNEVFGGDGNDLLTGLGTLEGGAGDDTLFGGGGVTLDEPGVVFGGEGDDVIRTSALSVIEGGAGDDRITTEEGGFVLTGEGADTVEVIAWDSVFRTTIDDFDPSQDALSVQVLTADGLASPSVDPLVGVTMRFENGATLIVLGDRVLVELQGYTPDEVTLTGTQVDVSDSGSDPVFATQIQVVVTPASS